MTAFVQTRIGERRARRILRTRAGRLGAALILALAAFALVGPVLSGHDPYVSDFAQGAGPLAFPVGPGRNFPLGADRLFRDQLARLAHGARLSLAIALAATLIASTIGAAVGILAGWLEGGWVDAVLMRTVDVGLSFPFLLLVMAVGAALDTTTPWTVLGVLGATGWLGAARLLRAKTMEVKRLDYIAAARALGQTPSRILIVHVLPNVAGPLVVVATLSVAQMILAESVLSYLGVGVSPPTPTWGRMLFEGQEVYATSPWLLVAPAVAILTSVLGFNLLGEALRDALDPRET